MTTEFGPQCPLDHLLIPKSRIVDELLRPLGGLAVVRLDTDVQPLIAVIAEQADSVIPDSQSEERRDWYYTRAYDGGTAGARFNRSPDQDFDIDLTALQSLTMETLELAKDMYEATDLELKDFRTAFFVQRRTRIGENHSDFEPIVFWHGASKPGFKVLHNGQWIAIDNMPPHHALVFRGRDPNVEAHRKLQEPIVHTAKYRQKIRRVASIGW